jgi:Tfp pilus assembly protein PilO
LVPTIILLTCIGGVVGLCLWLWSVRADTRDVLRQDIEKLMRYQRIINQAEEISERSTAFAQYLEVSATADAALQQLLMIVERLAADHSVQITSLKPRPAAREKATVTYQLELDCSGGIIDLATFLHSLEYSPALLSIERLRLGPAPRSTTQELQAQLLITYTQVM